MPVRKIDWEKIACIMLTCVIALYFALICRINFSGNPYIFDSDLYCDLNYAAKAWANKSLFPEGWVFGNQIYIVATPVWISLIFGLTGNLSFSMGVASTMMAAGVLLSFYWMLKALKKTRWAELVAVVALLSLTLFVEGPIRAITGWQILFTMCSYYSCYFITAMLGFGCYLRCDEPLAKQTKGIAAAVGVLAFCTGLQSVRQTAVMVLPMLVLEGAAMIMRLVHGQKVVCRKTVMAAFLSACNFAGREVFSLLPVKQMVITGTLEIKPMSQILASIYPSLMTIFSLGGRRLPKTIFCFLSITALLWCLWHSVREKDYAVLNAVLLLFFSVGSHYAASLLTVMEVRNIYYFMLFPLCAVLGMYIFASFPKKFQVASSCLLLCIAMGCGVYRINSVQNELKHFESAPTEVVDFLQENGIHNVYTCWNDWHCISVAMASKGKLEMGFWHALENEAFRKMGFLCDPGIYEAPYDVCAYLFSTQDQISLGVASAESQGHTLKLMKEFPEYGISVFTSDANLMCEYVPDGNK